MTEWKIPHIGDTVKVWLPAETPWAECVAVHGNSTWDGKILNRLASEYTQEEWIAVVGGGDPNFSTPQWKPPHNYKEGDVLTFVRSADGRRWEIGQ